MRRFLFPVQRNAKQRRYLSGGCVVSNLTHRSFHQTVPLILVGLQAQVLLMHLLEQQLGGGAFEWGHGVFAPFWKFVKHGLHVLSPILWQRSRHASRRRQPSHLQSLRPTFRLPEIVLYLLVEPTLGAGIEGFTQPDRHFGADPRTTIEQGGKSLSRDSERFRGFGHRKAERIDANFF